MKDILIFVRMKNARTVQEATEQVAEQIIAAGLEALVYPAAAVNKNVCAGKIPGVVICLSEWEKEDALRLHGLFRRHLLNGCQSLGYPVSLRVFDSWAADDKTAAETAEDWLVFANQSSASRGVDVPAFMFDVPGEGCRICGAAELGREDIRDWENAVRLHCLGISGQLPCIYNRICVC